MNKDYWINREFEKMYQEVYDPWGCSNGMERLDNKLFLSLIFDYRKRYTTALDIGCGIGGLTKFLYNRNLGNVSGCDISETAINKAGRLYPYIDFFKADIQNDEIGQYELITMSEILWYIDEAEKTFETIENALIEDGILAVHQYFPFTQEYHKHIFNGMSGLFGFLNCNTKLRLLKQVHSYYKSEGVVLLALFYKDI